MKDLCKEKKFIDLEDTIYVNFKEEKIESISDTKNNLWITNNKKAEGSFGAIDFLMSTNKKYSDVVVKTISDDNERKKEVQLVLFFLKHKCLNFLNSGVMRFRNFDYVIMEQVDNDMLNFDPRGDKLLIFRNFINFISSGYLCSYNYGYIYTDIKLENIGIKKCSKDNYVFTFLDFGSFYKLNSRESVSMSFQLNKKALEEDKFSKVFLFYFSTLMTLLLGILKIFTTFEDLVAFDSVLLKLEDYEYYESTILSKEFYEVIRIKFEEIIQESMITNQIFNFLYILTEKEVPLDDFMVFMKNLKNYM